MVEFPEVENLEFKWGKKRGIGGKKKDVRFYESFTYDGVEYALYECVYLYKEEEPEPYIGKLIKIWENADKTKRIKVLWFFRPSEISNFLGNDQILDNELFLACGEGVGLANVNPLEAIAGKCNVVCISKDNRNPQPSNEDLQTSDFIFYRTFDVGHRRIMNKIAEMVAGIEVKFIFNRPYCQKSNGILKLDLEKKDIGRNVLASDEIPISSEQKMCEKHITEKTEGNSADVLANENVNAYLGEQPASLVEKPAFSVDTGTSKRATIFERQENIFSDGTTLRSKAKETALNIPAVKQKSLLEEKLTSSTGIDSSVVTNATTRQENVSNCKTGMFSRLEENADSKVSLVGQKSSLEEKVASRVGVQTGKMIRTNGHQENDKAITKFGKRESRTGKVSDIEVEEKLDSSKDSSELDNRPFKKMKPDGSLEANDDKNKNVAHELGKGTNGKTIVSTITNENTFKFKQEMTKESHGVDKDPSKKPTGDAKFLKPANENMTKASSIQPSKVANKSNYQVFEVTRRPNLDRSKWFKELPWEDKMRGAHDQGTLVLLENLDPSYASTEVEDIIWHAFKENCSAKMVPRIFLSSPHCGQAYVIFKTREAAEMVVTKLDEGCLLLPNGRPLIGSFRTPCFMGKQSTFFGHLVIDRLKFQMQRGMREAVSTSHCSQPNTLEYDMAMEWCLLQERSDRAWRKLYERQGQELRKLKVKFKPQPKPKPK